MLEMVVHSPPAKREAKQPGTPQDVPPAVLAAAATAAAGVQQQAGAQQVAVPLLQTDGDLLGLQEPAVTQAEIHPERKREDVVDDRVTDRDRVGRNLTGGNARDDDRISLAGSDATDNPQLNPFTPECFAQIIGAAATAAATAVASSNRPTSLSPPPAASHVTPRRLNERKVPDFWEDRPEFWFRIFDLSLIHI